MTPGNTNLPEWIMGNGPDSDVVVSTRARLARSLADIPFPSRASGEDLNMVVRDVRAASSGLTERFPNLKALNIEKLSQEEKAFLLDAHLASVEQTQGGPGRVVIMEPRAMLSIMVNEEDHLRIQALKSGLAPMETWKVVDWVDDVLSERLNFGYSDRYGYLTASVSNVGTGLRLSVMMHLAGLAMKNGLNTRLKAAWELGVSIRGLFGEGTRSMGDFFQVSNEMTLGITEKEIIERVSSTAQYLLVEERLARKELLSKQRDRLVKSVEKALRTLQNARSITSQQAIALMSPIRLAAALEIIKDCPVSMFNELLIGMRVWAGQDGRAGMDRAELLRKRLAGMHLANG